MRIALTAVLALACLAPAPCNAQDPKASPTDAIEPAVPAPPFVKVRQLVRSSDWANLDKELDALLAKGRKDGDFSSDYETVVDELAATPLPGATFDVWCEARPTSPYALLFRGKQKIAKAREALAENRASALTDEGRKAIQEELRGARADLERSAAIKADDPPVYVALLNVATGLKLDDDASKVYLERSEKARPGDFIVWRYRLDQLKPGSGGPDKLLELAHTAIKAHPDEPSLHLLLVAAHLEIAKCVLDRRSYLAGADVTRAISIALARVEVTYPRSDWAFQYKLELRREFPDAAAWGKTEQRFAQAGLRQAQEWLGFDLRDGRNGMAVDLARSFQWLEKAARQGSLPAQEEVGFALSEGRGVARDQALAARWYRSGIDQGSPEAKYGLACSFMNGEGVPKDNVEALRLLESAGESNHARSEYWAGVLNLQGRPGITADSSKGRYWLERASRHGSKEAAELLKKK